MSLTNLMEFKMEEKMGYKESDYWDSDYWDLVDDDLCSVDNMTDQEVRQSILVDLLTVISEHEKITWMALFRFLKPKQKERALGQLVHDEIYGLLEISKDNYISIKESCLQAAMDYAGVWLKGFFPPEGVETICLTQKGKDLIDKLGVDKAAESLMYDFLAEQKGINIKTVN